MRRREPTRSHMVTCLGCGLLVGWSAELPPRFVCIPCFDEHNPADFDKPAELDLKRIVYANLDNAKENDCDFEGWLHEDIAHDLRDTASDCAGVPIEDLLPHIASWIEAKRPVAIAGPGPTPESVELNKAAIQELLEKRLGRRP